MLAGFYFQVMQCMAGELLSDLWSKNDKGRNEYA